MTPDVAYLASTRLDVVGMIGLLLGGLALFLLGLEFLTAGLKAMAGNQLQSLIGMLARNRLRGVLTGAFVTALLNSSTITTVLMVGFVSAGLMTLAQSVPMIMGANIGSTVTAQIIAFDVSKLTPFMLAAGFLLYAFASRPLVKQVGGAVLGLGLLFLGIQFMGDAMRPLRTYQPFVDAMQDMENPVLGIVAGAVFTAIVQSSAATLAIVIALGGQGLMPLEAGIALILGANVGTCGTALLASIGKSAEAVQVAIVHLLFNVAGVLFWVFFIPQMAELARYISPSHPELQGLARLAAETPRQVANTHTIFSVANTLVLIWFTGPIAKLAQMIAPQRGPQTKPAGEPVYLDESSLTVPSLGLERIRLELARLGERVLAIVRDSARLLADGDLDDIHHLLERKQDADQLASAILHYIGRLSQGEHSGDEGERMVGFTQIASIFASISGIIGINLAAVSQQRAAEPAGFRPLRDDATFRFTEAVVQRLERAIRTIGTADDDDDEAPSPNEAPVREKIQVLAAAARHSAFSKLRLADRKDVANYQLAVDLIEQFRQIAQLSKAISRTTKVVR
jgi:phosphate:Na+ symporter